MVAVWKSVAKPLALLGMFAAVVGGFFHYVKVGPHEEKSEEEKAA
jgi:formate dehydrogenase iron-sulfur subunit